MHRIGAVAIVLFLALWARVVFAQNDSATPVPYVYRLKISNCTFDPGDRRQTGFRVQGIIGIVTALHGVADCKTVSAVADDGVIFTDLIITAVDIDHDMALLTSPELADLPTDGLAVSTLSPTEILAAPLRIIGYPLGLDKQDIDLIESVREIEALDRVIPDDEESTAFLKRKSPDIDIDVLNLQVQLLPGHSGAPVLDDTNGIVAVGDGGLRSGTVGRSWAIPWSEVQLQSITLLPIKQRLSTLSTTEPGLALAFSSTYPEQPTSSAKLVKFSGRLVDQQTNRGIGNTEVLLVFDEAGEYQVSYSDPRGFFTFEFTSSKERARGTIWVEAAGYEYLLQPVDLGTARSLARILLRSLPVTPTPTVTFTPTPQPTAVVTPVSAPTSIVISCQSISYPTRLHKEMRAYVAFTPPQNNVLRERPSKTAPKIGKGIEPGGGMMILDGPECSEDSFWWYVQSDNGDKGWTSEGKISEYWLIPDELSSFGGFNGTWVTNHNEGGWVILNQTGSDVEGRYYNGSKEGDLKGKFEFVGSQQDYSIIGTYKSDDSSESGVFRFKLLDLKREQFQGCWRDQATGKSGDWCGWRKDVSRPAQCNLDAEVDCPVTN